MKPAYKIYNMVYKSKLFVEVKIIMAKKLKRLTLKMELKKRIRINGIPDKGKNVASKGGKALIRQVLHMNGVLKKLDKGW